MPAEGDHIGLAPGDEFVGHGRIGETAYSDNRYIHHFFDLGRSPDIEAGFVFLGRASNPTRAAMGADGIDDELGISLIGSGLEVQVAGNIYIDVDNNSLTADEQESIRLDLLDIVPAYMYVHIGYENVSGQFIEYFVMGL